MLLEPDDKNKDDCRLWEFNEGIFLFLERKKLFAINRFTEVTIATAMGTKSFDRRMSTPKNTPESKP